MTKTTDFSVVIRPVLKNLDTLKGYNQNQKLPQTDNVSLCALLRLREKIEKFFETSNSFGPFKEFFEQARILIEYLIEAKLRPACTKEKYQTLFYSQFSTLDDMCDVAIGKYKVHENFKDDPEYLLTQGKWSKEQQAKTLKIYDIGHNYYEEIQQQHEENWRTFVEVKPGHVAVVGKRDDPHMKIAVEQAIKTSE